MPVCRGRICFIKDNCFCNTGCKEQWGHSSTMYTGNEIEGIRYS
jgi:hypothetical protein